MERCNKRDGNVGNATLVTAVHRPMDVQVFHPLRQPRPERNPCLNNGGCESLCLLVPSSGNNIRLYQLHFTLSIIYLGHRVNVNIYCPT